MRVGAVLQAALFFTVVLLPSGDDVAPLAAHHYAGRSGRRRLVTAKNSAQTAACILSP